MAAIERLIELEKAATPGPWAVAIESGCSFLTTGDYSEEIRSDGDLELAAEMRNALPRLLAVVEAIIEYRAHPANAYHVKRKAMKKVKASLAALESE